MVKQRQKLKQYKPLGRDKESDSDGEETELFVRKKSPKKEIPTMEINIEDGDTLQSLAIRYHCAIEDLKRLNNIHKENEIFARRTIKVPHRPFSEALAAVHHSGANSPNSELRDSSEPSTSKLIDIEEVDSKLQDVAKLQDVRLNSPFRSSSSPPKNASIVNEIIFNSSIQRSSPVRHETIHDLSDDESGHLLPQRDTIFEPQVVDVSKLSCHGSDWDISWPILIVCIVVVVVAAPLIWAFYIAEHPEKYHLHEGIVRNGSLNS